MKPPTGVAGRLAATFIHSKLTPLVIVASLLLGVYAVLALPREEEPQIIVPMIDVFVDMPGASPTEVEQRVTRPARADPLGDSWRRVPLLHLESEPRDDRGPLPRRPGRRARARPAQSEARGECRRGCRPAHQCLWCRPARSTTCRSWRSRSGAPDTTMLSSGRWQAQLQEALKELPDISEVTIIGGRPAASHGRSRSGRAVRTAPRSARRCSRRWRAANVRSTSGDHGSATTAPRASKPAVGSASLDGVEIRRRRHGRWHARASRATWRRSRMAAASRTTT